MARAVLALDESNEEANNILKAASAASGVSTNVDESQIKAELNSIAIEVQTALNSEDFPEAERLIRQYMEKHSGIPGSEKILKDVQVARRKFNENKIWEQENLVQAEKAAKQVESASRRKKLQVVALVVAVVAVVVVVAVVAGNAPPLDQMEQVNIDDMIQLKKDNSSAADAYKGRWVTANGLVKTEVWGKVTVLGLRQRFTHGLPCLKRCKLSRV